MAAEDSLNTPAVANEASNTATTTVTKWIDEAIGGLARGELNQTSSALLLDVIVPALVSIVLIIATYFLAKLLGRWISAGVCQRVDETLGKFVGRLVFYGTLTLGSLGILSTAGISVAGAAAVLTAAGFAIGLAFQGTLSNFAAGVLLLVFRPFKVGDMVVVGGVTGKVNEIDLFTTTLDTADNRRLIMPNSSISGTTIENVTYHDHRRIDLVIGVSYGSDIELTRQVITETVESLSAIMVPGPDRGYKVFLSNLAASSVDWTVRFWSPRTAYWDAREMLLVKIKQSLDQNGIQIPFPQMQLHFTESESSPPTIAVQAPTSNLPQPKMNVHAGSSASSLVGTLAGPGKTRPRIRGEAS